MNLDGDTLLLELINTTPVEHGEPTDALEDDPAAEAWMKARGGSGTAEEIALVREVRDALQDVVRGQERADRLAGYLSRAAMVPVPHGGGLEWHLEAPPGRELAVRAVLAWYELEESRPGRLRPCGNPECRRFLIDRSHANRAQWCSMAVCGNRMKARRHYERSKRPTRATSTR